MGIHCLFPPQDGKPVKKWVNMSQEFINQHTVEHKGKQICKYFLEGRCIKVNLIIFKNKFLANLSVETQCFDF